MQDQARKLTFGAMMTALFVVLCAITVYVPVIGSVTMFFTPLPIMLYRIRYDRKASLLVIVAAMIVSLIGGLLLLPVAFVFSVLGLVVGEALAQQKTKLYTFMAAGTSFLITTMILYMVMMWVTGINFVETFTEMIVDTQKTAVDYMTKFGEMPEGFEEQFNDTFHMMFMILPTAFIMSTFIFGFFVIVINLPVVKRLGHTVPQFPPFRQLKLPVLIVWVYLIIILMPLFGELVAGSMTELIYMNGSFLLRFLFLLQGISFIQHMMYEMKAQKWLSILLTVLALLLSPLTIIIGILDTGINLRAWVGKDNSK